MKLIAKAIVLGIVFFIMVKIGWFTIKAAGDLELLGWSAIIATIYAVVYVIIRELIKALASCCPGNLGYLVLIFLPWLTFLFMQQNLLPGSFVVNLSGGVQIVIGFILFAIWRAVDE